ncbi:MAG: hypothetical protein WBA51_09720 [Erythrobacter sp.]
MIGSERDALIDLVSTDKTPSRRGGPIAMFGLLVAAWVSGRVILWESPFPTGNLIEQAEQLLAAPALPTVGETDRAVAQAWLPDRGPALIFAGGQAAQAGFGAIASGPFSGPVSGLVPADLPKTTGHTRMASGHLALYHAAIAADWRGTRRAGRGDYASALIDQPARGVSPTSPLIPAASDRGSGKASMDRWTLDAWAFARQGSGSAPISQGRVPVYGASQAGAILQFSAAPQSKHDPRAYVRAYRALIDRPENEVAAGISARPLPGVPVRVSAEIRATDNRFGSDVRPAAFAITELPAFSFPANISAEVYAGAGYVGGIADTAFVDGQATLTREMVRFGSDGKDSVRLSIGAGAWGGAQRDAERLDVGPTMRLDLAVGDVPARVSLDWRERIGGDAEPVSGLAATLSTRF